MQRATRTASEGSAQVRLPSSQPSPASGRRSRSGWPSRFRTDALWIKNPLLCLLSYRPFVCWGDRRNQTETFAFTARCAVTTPRPPSKISDCGGRYCAVHHVSSNPPQIASTICAGGNPNSSLRESRTTREVAVCCNAAFLPLPTRGAGNYRHGSPPFKKTLLVAAAGIEPAASRLSSDCSTD